MAKGKPIPTKFDADEEALLKWIAKKSGLSVSEVVRRAVFFLNEEVRRRNGNVSWIIEELAREIHPMPGQKAIYGLRVAEDDPTRATARRAKAK